MSEYTPTLGEIRDDWAHTKGWAIDPEAAARRDDRLAMFDRAVAAHDAEVRAGVVPEEPEWEYGYELIESDTRDVLSRGWPFDTAEQAGEAATKRAAEEFDPEYPPLIPQVVRRSKAGPWLAAGEWVPVKQEGADDADPSGGA